MPPLLVAKRRILMGDLEDCAIRNALYRTASVYICPECGRYVRPYSSDNDAPRFKHMTKSPKCSYSGGARRKR
ncbi:hypothetical protein PMI09_00639 [Rhizobium sp. CF122]|nr:hypothetical protein PMI09_00639 [Rhizobium sp. CF122]